MINVLMCAHKSGDVIGLALRQLIAEPSVTRILVADGPHTGDTQFGVFVDEPQVKAVVDGLASAKIVYQYSDDCATVGVKANRILKHVEPECEWLLVVDTDEVYHEDALERLAAWLPTAAYGRYSIKTVDPYADFYHCLALPDRKPRLYRWFAGARCSDGWEGHQWIRHASQVQCPGGEWGGCGEMPADVCELYHLNALRDTGRLQPMPDGTVNWSGGNHKFNCTVEPLERGRIPASILRLGRQTL